MVIAVRALATIVLPLGAAHRAVERLDRAAQQAFAVGQAVGRRARRRLPGAAVRRHRLPPGRLHRELLTVLPRGGLVPPRAFPGNPRDQDRPRRARAAERTAAPVRTLPHLRPRLRSVAGHRRQPAPGPRHRPRRSVPACTTCTTNRRDMLRTLESLRDRMRGRHHARGTARAAAARRRAQRLDCALWELEARDGRRAGLATGGHGQAQAAAHDVHGRRRRSRRDGRNGARLHARARDQAQAHRRGRSRHRAAARRAQGAPRRVDRRRCEPGLRADDAVAAAAGAGRRTRVAARTTAAVATTRRELDGIDRIVPIAADESILSTWTNSKRARTGSTSSTSSSTSAAASPKAC